jgi:hypothetical protein
MRNSDIVELFDRVAVGTRVEIVAPRTTTTAVETGRSDAA